MASPTVIDIPHTLGRDEAIRRMERGVGKLASHIPGGAATVTHSWPSAAIVEKQGERLMLADKTDRTI